MDKNYCINCMKELPSESAFCEHCGHRVGEYVLNQRALKPMTVLNGKYLVGKVLGEGGFGITYLGLDIVLNHRVAIKEFFPIQLASRNVYESNNSSLTIISGKASEIFQKRLARYEAEARCLASIEALPGIVRVLNFFYENNTAYMIMEFIPGETLKEYRKKNNSRLSWSEASEIMRPIIQSLAVLHRNGIIHRDISPDNIMMTAERNLVLIDFGTAMEIEENDKSKEIELKRGYAPPEAYSSHGNLGPWTDVYEVCATLYNLVSGETLPDALALSQNTAKIVPLSSFDRSVPASEEAAIMMGLNPDIKSRIQSMDDLYDYLYSGRKTARKKKPMWIIGVVAAVIVVAAVVAAIILISNKKDVDSGYNFPTERESHTEKLSDEEKPSSKSTEDTAKTYIKKHGLSYTDVSLLEYMESGDGIVITGTDYSLTEAVIPEEIDGKSVTSISGVGSNVTLVVLPGSLKEIQKAAFKNCVYLESIYIPENVTSIGGNAFENCISLSEVIVSGENRSFYVEGGQLLDSQGNKYAEF